MNPNLKIIEENGTKYEVSKDASRVIFSTLLHALTTQERIEIVYRDGSKLRCRVGRSTGGVKLLLAIKTRRSTGGEAILVGFIDSIKFLGVKS